MPSDWVLSYALGPLGLAFAAVMLSLPVLIWRLILGAAFPQVGVRPVVAGYLAAFLGLAALSFGDAYVAFDAALAKGKLPETERWAVVPNGTVELTVLSLLLVLPAIGFIGVPWSAVLLKKSRFTLRGIFGSTLFTWIALALLMWQFPTNVEWDNAHHLEALGLALRDSALLVVFIGAPFLSAIYAERSRGGVREIDNAHRHSRS